jgi:type II secretory pathway component PulF
LAAPAAPVPEHEEALEAELAWSESDSREQSAQVAALQKQLAELVTLGFNLVGASGAKRRQHTETFTNRLHELQAELTNSKPVEGRD